LNNLKIKTFRRDKY